MSQHAGRRQHQAAAQHGRRRRIAELVGAAVGLRRDILFPGRALYTYQKCRIREAAYAIAAAPDCFTTGRYVIAWPLLTDFAQLPRQMIRGTKDRIEMKAFALFLIFTHIVTK